MNNKILSLFFFFFEINILSCNETVDTDLIKGRNGDFFLTKKLSLIAIFQKKKEISFFERLCVRYSDRGSKAFRIRAKKEAFFFKRDAHMLWIPEW